MTICIAATGQFDVPNRPMVIIASDRMTSLADTEFEPPHGKTFWMTQCIAALTAGSSAIQIELCKRTHKEVAKRLTKMSTWIPVEEVADIFSREMVKHKTAVTERFYLAPFGLDVPTLVKYRNKSDPEWLGDIAERMMLYKLGIATIITGLDSEGAHIYVLDENGGIMGHDLAGFAAIGGGRRHAESHFMFSKHSPIGSLRETILRTYIAKKRAEVAPGVGLATDMFVIGELGKNYRFSEDDMNYLEVIYKQITDEQEASLKKGNEQISQYLDAQIKKNQESQAAAALPQQQISTQSASPPSVSRKSKRAKK